MELYDNPTGKVIHHCFSISAREAPKSAMECWYDTWMVRSQLLLSYVLTIKEKPRKR